MHKFFPIHIFIIFISHFVIIFWLNLQRTDTQKGEKMYEENQLLWLKASMLGSLRVSLTGHKMALTSCGSPVKLIFTYRMKGDG